MFTTVQSVSGLEKSNQTTFLNLTIGWKQTSKTFYPAEVATRTDFKASTALTQRAKKGSSRGSDNGVIH